MADMIASVVELPQKTPPLQGELFNRDTMVLPPGSKTSRQQG
jgi:hypothetical protein